MMQVQREREREQRELVKALMAADDPYSQQYRNLTKNISGVRLYSRTIKCSVGSCTDTFHTLKDLKCHKLQRHSYE